MAGAAGITVITEELNEFNHAGRPHHIARPGIDSERFRPDLEPPLEPRERSGSTPDEFVLVYHGTVHYANQHEMLSLYLGGEAAAAARPQGPAGAPRRDRARRRRPAVVRALCATA